MIADAAAHVVIRTKVEEVAPAPAVLYGTHKQSGNGPGFLGSPHSLAVVGKQVIVSERENHQIRSVTIGFPGPSDESTVLLGNGSPGAVDGSPDEARLNGPTGLSYAAGTLWVSDTESRTIRRAVLGQGLETVAGSADWSGHEVGPALEYAAFDKPYALHVDENSQHSFILEGEVIRRMSPLSD